MGGLVIDVLVIFLWRTVVQLAARIKSNKWTQCKAIAFDARADGAQVTISYHFKVGGRNEKGCWDIPFLFSDTAERYARATPKGTTVWIRFDPHSPQRSVLLIADQYTYRDQHA